MTPETLYTISQLAKETDRPYDFWDSEIRAGRLKVLQPSGRNGVRLVPASSYEAWFEASVLPPRSERGDLPAYRSRKRDLASFKP